jgi:hypothetical protein
VTDGDGDTADGSLAIDVDDDTPTIVVNDALGSFSAGAQSTWADAPGADGFKSLSVTFNSYAIGTGLPVGVNTSLGTVTAPDANGNYAFTGSITADFTDDGLNNPETLDFTLTFDPDADSYDFDIDEPDPVTVLKDSSQGQLKAGGPDAVQTLLFGGTPPAEAGLDDVVFFGVVATAPKQDGPLTPPNDVEDLVVVGETDLTEAQIEAFLTPTNQIPTLINSATKMNVSTSGIGNNNNNLDGTGAGIQAGDESFVFNPEEVVDRVIVYIDNSVGGYSPPTEQLYYSVYYTDGSVDADVLVTGGPNGIIEDALRDDPTVPSVARGGKRFEIDGGDKEIDAVQLTMGNGTVKIPVIQWAIEEVVPPEPLQLDFTATLVDGDDDSSQDTFSINLLEPDMLM